MRTVLMLVNSLVRMAGVSPVMLAGCGGMAEPFPVANCTGAGAGVTGAATVCGSRIGFCGAAFCGGAL